MVIREFGAQHDQRLVLLHGGGLNTWNYEEAARLLAARFHVVLPVLDGHAGSDAPFTSIEDCALHLLAGLDARFGGRVLLLGGLSLGAQVVLEMLAQRSDICRFAMIESALAIPMPATAAMIPASIAMSYGLIKRRWFAKMQFAALHMPRALFERYYRDSCAVSRQSLSAMLVANSSYSLKPQIAGTQARVQVLVGERERPIMKKSAVRICEGIPGACMEILPGYSHGAFSLWHAQAFARRTMAWIEGGQWCAERIL